MDPPILFDVPQLPTLQKSRPSKESQIKAAVAANDRAALARLAKSKGGLLSDPVRRNAWPILLGLNHDALTDPDWRSRPPHRDEDQARLDVDRAFIFYPAMSEPRMRASKSELYDVIVQVLRAHPSLSYFQGYHDIAQLIYMVFGHRRAAAVLEHLSLHRLRDFMMPTLQPALDHLNLIPALLARVDVPLSHHLRHTKPFYALSAVLTLFAHDVQSYADIGLLFDFFFACDDAAVPIYLYCTIMVHRRDDLFECAATEPEMLHALISRLPQPLPVSLTDAMSMALALYSQYPPASLSAWSHVSQFSVLRTWRPPETRPAAKKLAKLEDDEYDYIELHEVHEKPAYAELDALVDRQIADAEKRARAQAKADRAEADRAAKAQAKAARAQLRQRRSATKRLASAVARPPKDDQRQREAVIAQVVNGTAGRGFVYGYARVLGMSVCVGIMGVWVAWFLRNN